MGRTAKPRKPHRPRGKLVDPVSWAVAGVHTLHDTVRETMMAPVKATMENFRAGRADRDDWNELAQAMNVAESLAQEQVGRNLLPQIKDAQTALRDFGLRLAAGGTSTCQTVELKALDEGIFVYEAQLRVCTQADLGRAVRRVKALHTSGAMIDVGRLYESMKSNVEGAQQC
jgi:hypothetical protein